MTQPTNAAAEPPGALERWRYEIAVGKRGDPARPGTWPKDELWRAACWERSGLHELAAGRPHAAADDFAKARAHMAEVTPQADRSMPFVPLPRRRGRTVPT